MFSKYFLYSCWNLISEKNLVWITYLTVHVRYNNFFLRMESNMGDQCTKQIIQHISTAFNNQKLVDCGVCNDCNVHSFVFYKTGHTLKQTLNIETADHETGWTIWFLRWSSLTVSHGNSDYLEYRFFIQRKHNMIRDSEIVILWFCM